MSLEGFLNEIKGTTNSPKYSQLVQLSELSGEQVDVFKSLWSSTPESRKTTVLERLTQLADENFALDFSIVFNESLKDESGHVREKAIRGLWESEDRLMIRTLVSLLNDDKVACVRVAAAETLGKFADLAQDGNLLSSDEKLIRECLINVLGRKGEDMEVRRKIIESISGMEFPERDKIIQAAYDNGNSKLLQSAICAMGRTSNSNWLPKVLSEMSNNDPEIRYEAVVACGKLGEDRIAADIVDMLQDEDHQVRVAAVRALGEIGGPLAKKALDSCLELDDEMLQQSAAEALSDVVFSDDPLAIRLDP